MTIGSMAMMTNVLVVRGGLCRLDADAKVKAGL